eukprot:4073907-Pyramimonas_sp.AAC.1
MQSQARIAGNSRLPDSSYSSNAILTSSDIHPVFLALTHTVRRCVIGDVVTNWGPIWDESYPPQPPGRCFCEPNRMQRSTSSCVLRSQFIHASRNIPRARSPHRASTPLLLAGGGGAGVHCGGQEAAGGGQEQGRRTDVQGLRGHLLPLQARDG